MRTRLSQTTVVFTFLIVALLLSSVAAYRTITDISEGENWLVHTYTVLGSLDSVELSLRKSENRAQNFVRSGNSEFLKGYRESSSELDSQIESLQSLTRDNPSQQQLMGRLKSTVAAWKQQLDTVVGAPAGIGKSLSIPSQGFQPTLEVVQNMKGVESQLLPGRSRSTASKLQITRIGIVASAIVTLVFLIFAAYLVRKEAISLAREKESRLQLANIVDSSDDAIISKTLDGNLTSWNSGAERLYGYKAEEVIGKSINLIIPPERQLEMKNIFETLRRGERIDHLETVRVRRDGKNLHVELTVSPVHDEKGKITGASAIGRDITARKQMEESLRHLTARILEAEDDERRRIARDLHDTTVQELALLSINLAQLKTISDPGKVVSSLMDAHELTNRCVQELRTLSYVLHPPMLDELGLASALKIYAEGFSQRSGITLGIEVSPRWERLSRQIEIALFRVAQESLSNVVRHSGGTHAHIKLDRNGEIRMAITDQGGGFSKKDGKEVTYGVGILGMRERIKQFGGSLTIDSSPSGTSVEARLPLPRGMDG